MEPVKIVSEREIIETLFERRPELESCRVSFLTVFKILCEVWGSGGKLLVCGNGGSAADSEHIVGELAKSFMFKRPVDSGFASEYERLFGAIPAWLEGSLPAISLVSQSALSTAIANDGSAEGVFAQQVYCYGCAGDALLAISTSGGSRNVVEAARVAKAKGMRVVALTGSRESALSRLADGCVRVPEDETFRVQELHLPVYHALCAAVEARFFL